MRALRWLPPGFEIGDRRSLFCVRHSGVATDHLDFAVDEGARLGAIFFSLRRLAGEGVAHIELPQTPLLSEPTNI